MTELMVIGWKQRVDLPEWGLKRLRAKIDTGAKTSALGVAKLDLEESPAGNFVAIEFCGKRKRCARVPVLGMVVVKSSSGQRELRPLVETTIRIGPVIKSIRLTLTNREAMCHPMLIGRAALAGDFLVDVTGKNLLA